MVREPRNQNWQFNFSKEWNKQIFCFDTAVDNELNTASGEELVQDL